VSAVFCSSIFCDHFVRFALRLSTWSDTAGKIMARIW
jgi:hypothetical protein